MAVVKATMEWGRTPFTSCFFDGCIEMGARHGALGTKYNILPCGGVFFANAVDCLAAIREVVYQRKQADAREVAAACRANFKGHERLRAQLLAAPKHGNDDPRLDDIIDSVQRLRRAASAICRDPRDGTKFGNTHITKAGAALTGKVTPGHPGRPSGGHASGELRCALYWCRAKRADGGPQFRCQAQCGQELAERLPGEPAVPERHALQPGEPRQVRAMLNVYFNKGGQELQINSIDTEMLRAAQKNPGQYRDLVVRVAGFSEFFVNLTPEMQEEIIARTAHM
jgi:formate C-acetyltransferase